MAISNNQNARRQSVKALFFTVKVIVNRIPEREYNGTVLIIMLYIYIKSDTSEQYSLLVFIIHRFPPSAAPTHYTDRPMRIYVTATTPLLQRRTDATNALRERRTAAESLVWSADPRPMHGTKLIRFSSCGDCIRIRI